MNISSWINIGRSKSVPLVLQYEIVECGAASLSMILQYFGKYLPLSELRYQCGVSRDGSNMLNIKKAAIHYGLDVSVSKPKIDELLSGKVQFPCLAWWNRNHFLILENSDGKRIYVADPAGGKYKVDYSELERSFSGLLLQFSPTSRFKKSGNREREILNFLPTLFSYKQVILFLLFISTALIVTSLASSGLSGAFVQMFLEAKRYSLGLPILWISILVVILSASLTSIQLSIVRRMALTIQRKLSVEISLKILSVNYNFFASRLVGDIASRLNLSENISNVLVNQVLVFVLGLVGAFLITPFLLLISWELTLVSLAYVILNILIALISTNLIIDSYRSIELETGKVSGITVRMLSDTRTIKASALENEYLSTFQNYYTPVLKKTQEVQKTMNFFSFLSSLTSSLYDYGTIAYSGFLVMDGSMNLAGFMAFQVLRSEITIPLLGIASVMNQLQQAEAELGRLQDLRLVDNDIKVRSLDDQKILFATSNRRNMRKEEPNKSSIDYQNINRVPQSISAKNISLSFSPLSPNVLTDLNFEINAQQMFSIIGPSGSGKSTLIKVLVGLYDPTSGSVLYDGHEWMNYKDISIRNSFAYVSQEVNIFRGSIYDNLTMYNDNFAFSDVREIASLVCFDEVVMDLPQGYNTLIGDKGNGLSGGQLQRLSLARALLKKPEIIFLDEATSALDVPTESEVLINIKSLNKTVVAVAHRLKAAKLSDQVLVLEHGKSEELGSPQELLNNSESLFSKLVNAEKI